MSILDHIPEAERVAVLGEIANERPFEPASANEIALRWCVMKLAGRTEQRETDLENIVIPQLQAELESARGTNRALLEANENEKRSHAATTRKLGFANARLALLKQLDAHVGEWVNKRGSLAQDDDAIARAFHAIRDELAYIEQEEQKP